MLCLVCVFGACLCLRCESVLCGSPPKVFHENCCGPEVQVRCATWCGGLEVLGFGVRLHRQEGVSVYGENC